MEGNSPVRRRLGRVWQLQSLFQQPCLSRPTRRSVPRRPCPSWSRCVLVYLRAETSTPLARVPRTQYARKNSCCRTVCGWVMRAVLNYFETLSMANEKCRWEQRGLGGADTVCERKRDSGAHTHSNTYSEEEKHSCDPKAHSRGGHTHNNAGVCAHSRQN